MLTEIKVFTVMKVFKIGIFNHFILKKQVKLCPTFHSRQTHYIVTVLSKDYEAYMLLYVGDQEIQYCYLENSMLVLPKLFWNSADSLDRQNWCLSGVDNTMWKDDS